MRASGFESRSAHISSLENLHNIHIPTYKEQAVRIRPEFLASTELSLEKIYHIRDILTYEDNQPTRVLLHHESEAVYAAHWFEVVEE